ncbi:MAG: hypothetical protein JWR50_2016 [Mucilaginibacter sp.]|nr:hypothetical protein [Mucilaginibacter sp.]
MSNSSTNILNHTNFNIFEPIRNQVQFRYSFNITQEMVR